MGGLELAFIALIGWFAASFGAIAGGNSLLTVPALILMGVEPSVAIASNMFGITFLCLGAGFRFARSEHLRLHPTLLLCLAAIPGSLLGAHITLSISADALRTIIIAALGGIVLFLIFKPSFGEKHKDTSRRLQVTGFVTTSMWAVYGGLFSGGYTTVLTVAVIFFFGLSLLESVATTKIINLGSSLAATLLFAAAGAIDYDIAIPLAISMLLGGYTGAHLATRLPHEWIRKIMILIVTGLAAATAIFF